MNLSLRTNRTELRELMELKASLCDINVVKMTPQNTSGNNQPKNDRQVPFSSAVNTSS